MQAGVCIPVDCFGKCTRVHSSLEREILKCKGKLRRFTYPGRQASRQAAVRPVIGGSKSNFNFNSPRNLFDSFKHRKAWTGGPRVAIIPFLSIASYRKEKAAVSSRSPLCNLLIQRLESWHHCFNA